MTNLGHERKRTVGVAKDEEFYIFYGESYWEDKAKDEEKVRRTKKLNWRKL